MTIHKIELPANLDIFHRVTHASLSVKRFDGKVTSSINWSAIGSTTLKEAEDFARTINYLVEHGNSIVAMIESGELQTIIETQMFSNGKSVFIPMEVDERGVLGFDMQKDTVEYLTYGSILYEYDERFDVTDERERNREDYERKLAKHRKQKS